MPARYVIFSWRPSRFRRDSVKDITPLFLLRCCRPYAATPAPDATPINMIRSPRFLYFPSLPTISAKDAQRRR